MKTTLTILTLVFAFFIFSLPETADAARLGGGRSFGAKPFMSNPAPNIFHQTPPAAQGQAQRQATATAGQPRTGMFGGMGGLFGGLLAGTLIGSLLAGHGFAGGGMMDILILGLLIYLALKLFARMRSRPAEATAGAADSVHQYTRLEDNSNSAGWDRLRDTGGASSPQGAAASSLPDDFDAEEFLRGAKMVYNRLQRSWDKRDLNDIAEFATPAVMQTVREQMEADPTPSTTEVLLVNAHVLDVERDGDSQRAQAFFDVLLREDKNQETPSTVREIWHFVRPITNGNWQLDGIQQVGHG